MGRPSSYTSQNPVTKKWNWYAKCGSSGPGGFDSKREAEISLRLHEVGCKNC